MNNKQVISYKNCNNRIIKKLYKKSINKRTKQELYNWMQKLQLYTKIIELWIVDNKRDTTHIRFQLQATTKYQIPSNYMKESKKDHCLLFHTRRGKALCENDRSWPKVKYWTQKRYQVDFFR